MGKLELDQLRHKLRLIANEGSKKGGYTSRQIAMLARERYADEVAVLEVDLKDLGLMSLLRSTRTGRAQLLDETGADLFGDIKAAKSFMVFADRPNGRHEKVQKNTEDLTLSEVDQLILSIESQPPRERKDLRSLKELRAKAKDGTPLETTISEVLRSH